MNGQELATLGRKARADRALDETYSFNGKPLSFREAIDGYMFVNGEAKMIDRNMKGDAIKPRIEYRLEKANGAFVIGQLCAFNYLGKKLRKNFAEVDGTFTGRIF